MRILIREALPADLLKIEKLEKECFTSPWNRAIIEVQLAGPGRLMLAAEAEGCFAGYMGLQYVLDEGYVTNVCTAPEYRRRGVASALIDAMSERARALGLAFLSLEARVTNEAAIRLYECKGFARVGIRPGYYERPVEDALIMELRL